MNNWRLLLLAVAVVVQPIKSYTESNLFDGPECCERSTAARLDGTRKTDNERRLNSVDGNLEKRRVESRLTSERSSFERSKRRISPELRQVTNEERFAKDYDHRHRVSTEFREARETRQDHIRNRDVLRSTLVQNDRDSFESRQESLDTSRNGKLTRGITVYTAIERESRNRISRIPIHTNRVSEDQRVSPNRQTETGFKRERNEIAGSYLRRDRKLTAFEQSENRIQFDYNTERAFDRRTDSNRFSRDRSIPSINAVRGNAEQALVSRRSATRTDARKPSDERMQQREIRDGTQMTQESLRSVTRNNARESSEGRKHQREIRDNSERRQDSRIIASRMDARKSSVERRQQREARNTERMQESSRTVARVGARESSVERRQQREARDTERMQESRRTVARMDARESSVERRQQRKARETERMQESRRTAARMDARESSVERRQQREARETERMQESRRTAARMDARESSVERRQQREARETERMQESRRTAARMDARESSVERRQQREARETERMQESRSTAARMDARESSVERRQQEARHAERMQESRRSAIRMEARESSEEQRQHRKIRDNTKKMQDSRRTATRMDARQHPAERRMQESRRSAARMKARESSEERRDQRQIRDNTERMRDKISFVHNSPDVNHSEKDHKSPQDRPNLRRQALERSVELRELYDRSVPDSNSAERRHHIRNTRPAQTTHLERVVRNRDDVRENGQQIMQREERDYDRTSRIISSRRTYERMLAGHGQKNHEATRDSTELRREVRLDERLDSLRRRNAPNLSSRTLQAKHSQETRDITVRKANHQIASNSRELRADAGIDARLDSRRQRIDFNRFSKRSLAEHKLENRDFTGATRKIQDARNRGDIRMDDKLYSRRQIIASNHANERLEAERRQENRQGARGSRDVKEISMDARRQRDSRESRAFRETRDANELLTGRSRKTTARSDMRIKRERNTELPADDRNSRTDRRESRQTDIRSNNENLERMSRANPFTRDVRYVNSKRDRRSHGNIDSVAFHDIFDSEKSGEPFFNNWQIVFYTLQFIYLSSLLTQMLTETTLETKKRSFNIWNSSKNLIKAD